MDLLASIQVGHWQWTDFGLAGMTAAMIVLAFAIFVFLFFHNRPRSKPE